MELFILNKANPTLEQNPAAEAATAAVTNTIKAKS